MSSRAACGGDLGFRVSGLGFRGRRASRFEGRAFFVFYNIYIPGSPKDPITFGCLEKTGFFRKRP